MIHMKRKIFSFITDSLRSNIIHIYLFKRLRFYLNLSLYTATRHIVITNDQLIAQQICERAK